MQACIQLYTTDNEPTRAGAPPHTQTPSAQAGARTSLLLGHGGAVRRCTWRGYRNTNNLRDAGRSACAQKHTKGPARWLTISQNEAGCGARQARRGRKWIPTVTYVHTRAGREGRGRRGGGRRGRKGLIRPRKVLGRLLLREAQPETCHHIGGWQFCGFCRGPFMSFLKRLDGYRGPVPTVLAQPRPVGTANSPPPFYSP